MLRKSGATYDFDLSKAMHKNKLYTVDADAGTFDEANSSVMYYPFNDDPVKFVAYYPYSISADDVDTPNTLTFDFTEQDEADGSEKEAKDFIFHKDKEEVEYNGNTSVSLKFQHKFCKILITIINESGEELTAENFQVRLNNMPQTATVDLTKLAKGEAGALTLTGTTDIKPHIRRIESDHAYIEAIVPIHGSAYTTRQFKFTVGTKEYKYPVTNDFVSGNSYAYVLTLAVPDILDMHDGLSNCYLVTPGTTSDLIPITRAFTIGGLDPSTSNDAIELVKLWDDNSVISSISELTNDRKFTVTTNDNKGSAVVAIRDKASQTIYWSWHIWALNPAEITTVRVLGNVDIMDRNLGATTVSGAKSWGHAYQWGRKDPFPLNNSNANSYNVISLFSFNGEVTDKTQNRSGTINGIIQSIQNPMIFLKGITSDWLPTNQNNLWNTSLGQKAVYDPCPVGWRTNHYNDQFGGSSVGWGNDGHTMRIMADGVATTYGSSKWFWMARSFWRDETYGRVNTGFPDKGAGIGDPQGGQHKSNGCVVRCVRD
jgi:hypothetical protein